jgi:BirA family biotin operon repressor/biotin-[acetyl-CoA-carboxylase] ligase
MPDPASNPLAATGFGPVERFAEIDSTNRWLSDQARAGAPSGLVAVADAQSAGRGRLGRSWTAPAGGSLLVSVLLRPTLALDRWHLITAAAGLAAAEAVTRLTDGSVAPRLKWPNDLVLSQGKLAGILAERADDALVVGMGLNIDWPSVPEELTGIATAISLAGASSVPSRDVLLVAWLRRWHGWLTILDAPAGAQRVRAAYEHMSATLGTEVRIQLPNETFEGTATAFTDSGHLVLDTALGRREISAGDLIHLRVKGRGSGAGRGA